MTGTARVDADQSGTAVAAFGVALLLLHGACAGPLPKTAAFDDGHVRAHAVSTTDEGIRVSAAAPSVHESLSIFGVDLNQHDIQPLWLEIENHSERSFYLVQTGLDPEYFSPGEVAFLFHRTFQGRRNAALDEHFEALSFDTRSPIFPGETVSGFVYLNQSYPSMRMDIDLIGRQWSNRISLVVPMPGTEALQGHLAEVRRLYGEADVVEIDDEAQLRAELEKLPCCAADEAGTRNLPLNLVLIGKLDEWGPAFVRRNYRYAPTLPWYAFGRAQDLAGHKVSRWVAPKPVTLRIWLTRLRYHGRPVWAVQASTNLGGRFGPSSEGMQRIDPNTDEARNDVVQDLLYSQMLTKVGFVKGASNASTAESQRTSDGSSYRTDGLRAVLDFGGKTVSLAEIDFFDWESPVDFRHMVEPP